MKFLFSLLLVFYSFNVNASNSCNLANNYDSFTFSVTWEPGYCNVNPNKIECLNKPTGKQFSDSNFSLHGLWPNKDDCGTNYGFCDSTVTDQSNFCNLPAINGLDTSFLSNLQIYMHGAIAGQCLERHEWWKHGSCTSFTPSDYFNFEISLLSGLNNSDFVQKFIQPNIGKTVSLSDFNKSFDNSFGPNSHLYITTSCENNVLQQLSINLIKNITMTDKLTDLINTNSRASKSSCGNNFQIIAANN